MQSKARGAVWRVVGLVIRLVAVLLYHSNLFSQQIVFTQLNQSGTCGLLFIFMSFIYLFIIPSPQLTWYRICHQLILEVPLTTNRMPGMDIGPIAPES